MTLKELEYSLPNGLHDATFTRIHVDYEVRRAAIEAEIWVGALDDAPPQRNRTRHGVLTFEGLEYVTIEPPRHGRSTGTLERPWVDTVESVHAGIRECPPGCFVAAFFDANANSCIAIVARDVNLTWSDEIADEEDKPDALKKSATFEARAWLGQADGRIRVVLPGGRITTVARDAGSRAHKHLFEHLRSILESEGKWPTKP